MKRQALIAFLNDFLNVKKFRDYTVNGLQVEGRDTIKKIVTAVTASQAAIDFATAENADALLVHHGYFWKGEPSQITGIKKNRLQALLKNDINLIAYHLPLDQHGELGNNILFGQALGLENIYQDSVQDMIWLGELPEALTQTALEQLITDKIRTPIISVGKAQDRYKTLAWCTGAAQDFLADAVIAGADAFISGEYAERTYHEANELGSLYLACGHHRSEIFGVRALAKKLSEEFDMVTIFFDEDNPL